MYQTANLLLIAFLISILAACHSTPVSENNTSHSFWSHRFGIDHNIAYGDLPRQKLDIYRQGNWQGPPHYFVPDSAPRPTFIYVHGGAWHGGSKESALWSLMPFIEKGWNVVNIEYTVGGNTAPNAADDVLLAMQWIEKHAHEYALDKTKVVISGDSAGGHLALLAGLINSETSHATRTEQSLTIKAVVNWFGIPDIKLLDEYLDKTQRWNYPRKWAGDDKMFKRLVEKYSPIKYLSEHSPAVISIHGTADEVVPIEQSISLHKKLNQYQIRNKLVKLEGGRHLGFTEQQFQIIYSEIFMFLDSLE